jgi:hypothetical protein
MVVERKTYPGDEIRARHLDFIRANWDLLCAVSYAGSIQKGRGMVLVNEADWIEKEKGILTEIKVAYAQADSQLLKGTIGDKEREWLRTCNGEVELIVGVIRLDNGFSAYRMTGVGDNTPKAIYERRAM